MVEELKGYRCPYCGATLTKTLDNEKFECNFCQNISFRVDNKTNIRLIEAYDLLQTYNHNAAEDRYSLILEENRNNEKIFIMSNWGLLLANFGVVYIKDFNNKVSIPTFSEYNPDVKSILDCDYYKNIKDSNINNSLKKEFEIKAKELDKVYKKIEKDLKDKDFYDVFICTKISLRTQKYPDMRGYTEDSKLASELYNELTKKGLKVFYSEKCCRGIEYDSQILSALVKSKKMVVIATCKDYLESQWVQSEWRRWINFIDCEDENGNLLKAKDSILLYLPYYERERFDLPRIIRKKKIQYFTSQLSLINLLIDDKENELQKTLKNIKNQDKREIKKIEISEDNKLQINQLVNCINRIIIKKQKEEINKQETTKKYFEKVDEKDIESINYLGDCFYYGKEGKQQDYFESVRWYIKAAEQGNATAQKNLGNCYYNGQGVSQDYNEAVKWYKLAAEKGNADAQNRLGNCYYNGRGVSQDYNEAVKWYRKALEQGDSDAQCNLGNCYYNGQGVPQDYNEAVRLYIKADERGNIRAHNNIGNCYYNGRGVPQNYNEAVKWYKKAAEQGDSDAQCNLGNCYYNGQGVSQDYNEAVKWYKKAAEQGNARAQYNLGCRYYYGEGVNKDYNEAVKWYKKAAEQGNARAQCFLGYCFEVGQGVSQDYNEAVKWYKLAAEQGDTTAQNNLGICYYNGRGVPKDYLEAVKWYKKAAEQGNADAQNNLGNRYYNGEGVNKDYNEAVKWYKKAAEQGNARAQCFLGYCFEVGQGVSQDYNEAVKWYKLAAEQRDATAQYNLGICYYNGKGVSQNYAEAVKWYKLAAEQGHMYAQYNLGNCYYDGEGVKKDRKTAIEYYKKAARQGHEQAKKDLKGMFIFKY